MTGSSQGIGQATALRLARDGADVALHGHEHLAAAETTAREIRGLGREAFVVAADLSTGEGPRALARGVRERWDSLDVLVHNAGPYPRVPFSAITEEEWWACFNVHVFGPATLTRELLPLLQRSRSGRIIFVSSVLAFSGSTHGAHYAAAKSAQLGLARSLARELAPQTTVNVVAPGSIDTAILSSDSPEQRASRERSIPLGRLGTADDVAAAIAFLASPGAAYLTGTTVHVNGGLRLD